MATLSEDSIRAIQSWLDFQPRSHVGSYNNDTSAWLSEASDNMKAVVQQYTRAAANSTSGGRVPKIPQSELAQAADTRVKSMCRLLLGSEEYTDDTVLKMSDDQGCKFLGGHVWGALFHGDRLSRSSVPGRVTVKQMRENIIRALQERSSHDGLAVLSEHFLLTNVGPDFELLRPEYFGPYLSSSRCRGDPGNVSLGETDRQTLEATLRALVEGSELDSQDFSFGLHLGVPEDDTISVRVSDIAGCEFTHDGQGTLRVKVREDGGVVTLTSVNGEQTVEEGSQTTSDQAGSLVQGRKLVGDKIVDPTVLLFVKSLEGQKPSLRSLSSWSSVLHRDKTMIGASVCPYPKAPEEE